MDVVPYKITSNWKEISHWSNVGMWNEKIIRWLIRRHCRDCSFVTKIVHAEKSGVRGVIVMDNNPAADDYLVEMLDDMTGRTVTIPAMFLQYRDGYDWSRENKNDENFSSIDI